MFKSISAENLKQYRLISTKLAHEYLLDCGVDPEWIKAEVPEEKKQHPIVKAFWLAYQTIGYLADSAENPLNHSHQPETEIAINLAHFHALCGEHQLELLETHELRRYLPTSQTRPLVCKKAVKSRLEGRNIWCWVFKSE